MSSIKFAFVSSFLLAASAFCADEQKSPSSADAVAIQTQMTNNTTAVYQSAEDLSKARLEVVNIRRSIEARRLELIKENPECSKLKKEIDEMQAALKDKADALEREYQKDKIYMELTSQWREKQKISYDVLSNATSARKGRKSTDTPSSSTGSTAGDKNAK